MPEENTEPALEVQPPPPDEVTLQALERVIRWLAHQINNPLATMSGNAQLLERVLGLTDDDPASAYPKAIRREVLRCSEILGGIVALCTLTQPEPEPTDLGQVLDLALERLVQTSGFEAVALSRDYSLPLPQLRADPDLLRQAFEAVLDNALLALPEGGEVKVRAGLSPSPGFAEVCVSDNGEGIDEADLARVTEPGFTTRPRARGLGLTYCHRVLLAHGGTLGISSRRGQGTVVRMLLPLPSGRPPAKPSQAQTTERSPGQP